MSTLEQDKSQVFETQKEIREMKAEMGEINGKIKEIHTAIMGSSMTQDGGLVERLRQAERKQDEIDGRLRRIEIRNKSDDRVAKILWAVIGGMIPILGWIASHLFKK